MGTSATTFKKFTTEGYVLEQAEKGFIEPLTSSRSVWAKSRLAVLADGSTVPVLLLLARKKFPAWDPEVQTPFWKNGDWQTETFDNVDLMTKSVPKKREGRRNEFGVPAGSPEYMKLWRLKNPDKMKAAQKRYLAKRKELLASLRGIRDSPRLRELATEDPADVSFTDLIEKLTSVINEIDGSEEETP